MCFAAKYVSLFLCNLSSITPYPQCLQIITYQRQNHSFFAYLDNSSLSLQIILLNLHVSTLCWFIIDVTEWIFNRAKSPMWLRGWRHIYIKGVTDALILTCWNFATSNYLSRAKQRERPKGCIIFMHLVSLCAVCVWRNRSYYIFTSAWGFQRCTLKDHNSYLLPAWLSAGTR